MRFVCSFQNVQVNKAVQQFTVKRIFTLLPTPVLYFSINNLLIAGLFLNTSLATEYESVVLSLNKVLKT